MGMFDSFMLKVKCPYCGEEGIIEFQTKQFDCAMFVWNEGEQFTGMNIEKGIVEEVYGGCNSGECNNWQIKRDGYKSGFGRQFYCDVQIIDKRVNGAINIRKDTYLN